MNETAHSYLKIFIFLVLFCGVSSCTIHRQFPFICFLPECVKQDFNLKPFKKKLQGQINAKKRKRQAKANAALRARKVNFDLATDTASSVGQSVQYTKYMVHFYSDTLNNLYDSVLITHSSAHKRIMDAGESAIEHLIRIRGVNNILYITFIQVRFDQADQSDTQSAAFGRINSIRKFLIQNGIPEKRIKYLTAH